MRPLFIVGQMRAVVDSGLSTRRATGASGPAAYGNLPKVLALVLRYRGNGDLKCSAKNDVCRMANPCDAITVEKHSA
jgi:hypothetical protein